MQQIKQKKLLQPASTIAIDHVAPNCRIEIHWSQEDWRTSSRIAPMNLQREMMDPGDCANIKHPAQPRRTRTREEAISNHHNHPEWKSISKRKVKQHPRALIAKQSETNKFRDVYTQAEQAAVKTASAMSKALKTAMKLSGQNGLKTPETENYSNRTRTQQERLWIGYLVYLVGNRGKQIECGHGIGLKWWK